MLDMPKTSSPLPWSSPIISSENNFNLEDLFTILEDGRFPCLAKCSSPQSTGDVDDQSKKAFNGLIHRLIQLHSCSEIPPIQFCLLVEGMVRGTATSLQTFNFLKFFYPKSPFHLKATCHYLKRALIKPFSTASSICSRLHNPPRNFLKS